MLKVKTFSVTVITQKSHYCYFLDCLGVGGAGRQQLSICISCSGQCSSSYHFIGCRLPTASIWKSGEINTSPPETLNQWLMRIKV